MALNTKTSVVDLMKSKNMNSSFGSREQLAESKYGIKNYTGSASQNIALMGKINTPAKPAPNPVVAPKPAPKPVTPVVAPKPVTPTAPKPVTPPPIDPLKQMQDQLKAIADAQFAEQEAMLGRQRESQLAELQMMYAQAVADGEISKQEAQEAFAKQKAEVDQQAYLDSQATNLSAQDRGVGNSQQMMGMIASDNARTAGLNNGNMSERDKKLSDISNRLNQIKTQKNVDTQRINADFDYQLAGAKAGSNAQMNQGLLDLNRENYFMDKGHNQQKELVQIEFNNSLKLLTEEQKHKLAYLAKEHGYDLAKMDKQKAIDLILQNDAQSHDKSMQDDQQSFTGGQNALDRAQSARLASMSRASSSRSSGGSSSSSSKSSSSKNTASKAVSSYQASKSTTGIDRYYDDMRKAYGYSVVQRPETYAMPIPTLKDNKALSASQKLKYLTGR